MTGDNDSYTLNDATTHYKGAFIAPYDGKLDYIILQVSGGTAGGIRFWCVVNTQMPSHGLFKTVEANKSIIFQFDKIHGNHFKKGDKIQIGLINSGSLNETTITSVWKYFLA